MNESLGTFMMIAAVVIIVSTLLFGTVFEALSSKNEQHVDTIQNEHQIQLKNE